MMCFWLGCYAIQVPHCWVEFNYTSMRANAPTQLSYKFEIITYLCNSSLWRKILFDTVWFAHLRADTSLCSFWTSQETWIIFIKLVGARICAHQQFFVCVVSVLLDWSLTLILYGMWSFWCSWENARCPAWWPFVQPLSVMALCFFIIISDFIGLCDFFLFLDASSDSPCCFNCFHRSAVLFLEVGPWGCHSGVCFAFPSQLSHVSASKTLHRPSTARCSFTCAARHQLHLSPQPQSPPFCMVWT